MIHRRPLYWGTFLITAGAVTLLARESWFHDRLAEVIPDLWPLLLIGFGVGLLLRGTRVSLAGGLLAAAMPGLFLGGLVAVGPDMALDCGRPDGGATIQRDGTLPTHGQVRVQLDCGDLSIDTAPGDGWRLEGRAASGREPTVTTFPTGVEIESASPRVRFGWATAADEWHLTVPADRTVDLDVEVNAGSGSINLDGATIGEAALLVNAGSLSADLAGARIERFSMDIHAADASLVLPARDDVSGAIEVDAGQLSLCIPEGLGVLVRETATLGSVDHPGLIWNGAAWATPGYDAAINHADVSIEVNVGSVTITLGGCS